MKDQLQISVIIPCWNAQDYVATAVSSALAQTGVTHEVIVVDDGSEDASVEVLQQFGAGITLIRTPNRGASAARNTGLQAATGAFVKYLDADDFLLPDCLRQQLAASASLSSQQFVYGRVFRYAQSSGQISPHSPRDSRVENQDDLTALLIDVPITSAPLYRRAMLDHVGGFRTEVALRDDFDLFTRVVLAGFDPVADKTPVYCYRSHDSSDRLSRRNSAQDYAALVAMYRHHLSLLASYPHADRRALVEAGLARSLWITARNALRLGYLDSAREMFAMAEACAPGRAVYGKSAYRVLVKALGPERAEAALHKLRRLAKRAPKP